MGLHKPIAYLNKAIKSDLIIVDGLIGDLNLKKGETHNGSSYCGL